MKYYEIYVIMAIEIEKLRSDDKTKITCISPYFEI